MLQERFSFLGTDSYLSRKSNYLDSVLSHIIALHKFTLFFKYLV